MAEHPKGVWKSGKGKGRKTPKGRQVTDEALNEIQELLGTAPLERSMLIEYLHIIQDRYSYLSAAHLRALASLMKLAQVEVYEVATFYAHLDIVKEGEEPPPEITVRVCDSLSCEMAGAQILMQYLKEGTDPNKVRVIRAPCMGRCDTAPVLEVGHKHVDKATLEKTNKVIAERDFHPEIPDYSDLDSYLNEGGYQTLKSCHQDVLTRDEVEQLVLSSGLRGFGGAGFPSGRKWSFVRKENKPRLMAVNADEGEPGTFKDRYYLERYPHHFLEGMLIAAWVVEAEKVYIYLRDEYPASREILLKEISNLENQGIVQEGYIELRRGAGAYICGEESAMIESIE
ncbi:MAG: NAD(P)H-dependent oxidoreductase subunit E, partial [Rhodobacteraceae bacterium]|nr:NAD(P)H-dependent oxidoreductase subunit E [Paracoccaceae bacterium]